MSTIQMMEQLVAKNKVLLKQLTMAKLCLIARRGDMEREVERIKAYEKLDHFKYESVDAREFLDRQVGAVEYALNRIEKELHYGTTEDAVKCNCNSKVCYCGGSRRS